jgi:signal transduction histidine kinase
MVALLGWLLAAAVGWYAVRLRRRLELVADAEHELRGALTAFGLALDSTRGTAVGRRLAMVLDAELCRARAGLTDLAAARTGARAATFSDAIDLDHLMRSSASAWGARVRSSGAGLVRGDRGRVAQALGNLLSNAREHGSGEVSARTSQTPNSVRVEVSNPVGQIQTARASDRGRGLAIAARAARESGGRLTTTIDDERATAVIELPLEPTRAESSPAGSVEPSPIETHEPRRAA